MLVGWLAGWQVCRSVNYVLLALFFLLLMLSSSFLCLPTWDSLRGAVLFEGNNLFTRLLDSNC